MSKSTLEQPEYVKERLESLAEVDRQLCSMLQEASQVAFTYGEVLRGNAMMKPQFQEHVSAFYSTLDNASGKLKKEIELLDENVGNRLLPINVNKKALGQDDDRLKEQMETLKEFLKTDNEETSTS
ncbi:Mediator complex protein [Nakaseomyces glabratus]|nr:Mediator complex protein [Nakaseomyces glabratus]KAH7602709.1 Mediator complex protein [Nakaseomyces glabratus]